MTRAKYIEGPDPEGLVWAGVDDPEAIRLAQTIEHPISGEVAMDLGYVPLPDGRAFGSTWREWGDVMVGAFGGHYLDYYMGDNVSPESTKPVKLSAHVKTIDQALKRLYRNPIDKP